MAGATVTEEDKQTHKYVFDESQSGGHETSDSCVCVCVQGGVTTIKKVLESVSNLTPVVLVKGSGKAADLLSDAVYYHSHITRNNQFARDDSSTADSISMFSYSEGSCSGPG